MVTHPKPENEAEHMSVKGLEKAREIYNSRFHRVADLKAAGHKVMGYISIHTPVELIEAAGMVPCRIYGDIRATVTEADRGLPAAFCPFMRNMLDIALKGGLDGLDGIVTVHPCDAQEKTVRVITTFIDFPYSYFIDIPSTVQGFAIEFFADQIRHFAGSLEKLTGVELTPAKINEAIGLYNKKRALVRELYTLKQSDPPLLTGTETLEVVLASQMMPVAEANKMLAEVIAEVRERPADHLPKRARILLWGSVVDDSAYVDVIEESGGAVVVDDLDEGTRPFLFDVAEGEADPIAALASKYLRGTPAARTFTDDAQGPGKKDNIADLEARYGHLGELAEKWGVDGVILQTVRYCDPHGYELVDVMDYVKHIELPFIMVEHNYSEGALAPLRTRVEAFVETLE